MGTFMTAVSDVAMFEPTGTGKNLAFSLVACGNEIRPRTTSWWGLRGWPGSTHLKPSLQVVSEQKHRNLYKLKPKFT